MNHKLLHTPDGVRDLFGTECLRKRTVTERIRNVITSFGYHQIEPPTFEYFDVFGQEIGTIPSAELYKFFDKEGNTLVLRPDFTPSIARAATRYFVDDKVPIRLWYQGSTFVNHSSYRGRLKESTQIGAELILEESALSDAEQIAMVILALKEAGLSEFQVSIGNVRLFGSLVQAAGLDSDTEEELKNLIRNKNSFGVKKLLKTAGCSTEDAGEKAQASILLAMLPSLFGGRDVLDKAAQVVPGCTQALASLDRLREVLEILSEYGLEEYVNIDLGMMSNYMYYTGIMFRGYTYGSGEAIVKGGRYDSLLRHFGKDAPAVGFVVVIDQLIAALERQNCFPEETVKTAVVFCTKKTRPAAIRKASQLRGDGIPCVVTCQEPGDGLPEADEEAVREQFRREELAVRIMEVS